MRRVFRDDHELFRDRVRRFVAQEIAPHYAEWEKAGIVPRFRCGAAPARKACSTAPCPNPTVPAAISAMPPS